jgi:hypothetical protein
VSERKPELDWWPEDKPEPEPEPEPGPRFIEWKAEAQAEQREFQNFVQAVPVPVESRRDLISGHSVHYGPAPTTKDADQLMHEVMPELKRMFPQLDWEPGSIARSLIEAVAYMIQEAGKR